jgi:hypothetical protein
MDRADDARGKGLAVQANKQSWIAIGISIAAFVVVLFQALLQWHDSSTKSLQPVQAQPPPLPKTPATNIVPSSTSLTSTTTTQAAAPQPAAQ